MSELLLLFFSPFQGTVLIENAEELMGFSKGEEGEVEAQVKVGIGILDFFFSEVSKFLLFFEAT